MTPSTLPHPDDVDSVVAALGHERVRWLVSDENPNARLRDQWRAEVLRRAGKLPPPPAKPAAVEKWQFFTTADLIRDTQRLIRKLPPDIDLVYAIPRSGVLPASIIATELHTPLGLITVRDAPQIAGQGYRLSGDRQAPRPEDLHPRHVLVVDDTVWRGNQMRQVLPRMRTLYPEAKITRAAVYADPRGIAEVELYERASTTEILEWNWPNSGHMKQAALDFDGILCEDCPAGDDDDGPRYRRFLAETKPLAHPRMLPVKLIVTGRHEKYRAETMSWLDRHGIRVEKLVMRNFPIDWRTDGVQRSAEFKADHFAAARGLKMFFESDPRQAQIIAAQTGKVVICPASAKIWPPAPRAPLPAANLDLAYPWGDRSLFCEHREHCGCSQPAYRCGRGGKKPNQLVTIDDCRGCLAI